MFGDQLLESVAKLDLEDVVKLGESEVDEEADVSSNDDSFVSMQKDSDHESMNSPVAKRVDSRQRDTICEDFGDASENIKDNKENESPTYVSSQMMEFQSKIRGASETDLAFSAKCPPLTRRRIGLGGLDSSLPRRWASTQEILGTCTYQYPLLYVSPAGTISVLLNNDIIVEITVDKSLRVSLPKLLAVSVNGRGSASCIMHTQGRIYQEDAKVFSQFGNDKLVVFGSQGILFTMRNLTFAYLVSACNIGGTTAIPLSCVQFPTLESDFSMTLLYMQSQYGEKCVPYCQELVRNAHYEVRPDGSTVVNINGIYIRQDVRGRVDVNSRPRHISVNPVDGSVHIRTHAIDMLVQKDQMAHVKRGEKRLHVSKSGLVVSDANCITSMDHFGRIVSST